MKFNMPSGQSKQNFKRKRANQSQCLFCKKYFTSEDELLPVTLPFDELGPGATALVCLECKEDFRENRIITAKHFGFGDLREELLRYAPPGIDPECMKSLIDVRLLNALVIELKEASHG